MFGVEEIIVRLGLALVLGAILGFERVWAHKIAGPRTYSMVALGAAGFVLIGDMLVAQYGGMSAVDVTRIAGQVVVGIGFLGAGLIVFRDNKVVNLTTASGIWVAAAIGIASGLGLYLPAFMLTILALFIFIVLWVVEDRFKKLGGEE